jgi:hypothetical protein
MRRHPEEWDTTVKKLYRPNSDGLWDSNSCADYKRQIIGDRFIMNENDELAVKWYSIT